MEHALKAVICVLNSKYIHSSLAPWYLAAAAEERCSVGIEVKVIEGTINESPDSVVSRIIEAAPRVIGFSCYIWNISETKRLIRLVKEKLPDAVIILGGPEVSYNAEDVLREEPLIDYIISGEGELPFAGLLDSIVLGKTAGDIPGLCYRKEGRIVTGAPNTSAEVPVNPYTETYIASLKGRIAYLETSRGCPYSCAFCLSGRCGGVRFFPTDRAKRDMLKLANSGAKTVKLVDRTFNAGKKRAAELFQFIIDSYGTEIPNGVCFHFEVAGDIIDAETLSILSKAPAGSIQLEIGLQSFNIKTLTAINRKTDVERLKANIARLTDMGNIHIHIDLIAGLPYEDLSSFEKSFNTAYELRPHMLQLGFLKMLHGSSMREDPDRFPCDYDSEPPYEVTSTPWLSRENIEMLHRTENALERLYNSGRFRRTLQYIIKQTGQTPFRLFTDFGVYAADKLDPGLPLDDFTSLAYSYFSGLGGIDPAVLRDQMVCDRLATNSSGRLPAILRIQDANLKKAVKALETSKDLLMRQGIKRGYAILYTENCLVYAEYRDEDPVTGEYQLYRYPLTML